MPASVPALVVDGASSVTLAGSGFSFLSTLTVDGVAVPASEYQVASDTLVTFAMPKVSKLGGVLVEVVTPGGVAQTNVTVTAVAPSVDLENSSPGFLIQSQGIGVDLAGAPADALFLCVSASNNPTSLPGIVDLAIGGGSLGGLTILDLFVVPAQGWLHKNYQTGGVLPSGLTLYVQAAVFTAASGYAMPGGGSNVQTGVVLF